MRATPRGGNALVLAMIAFFILMAIGTAILSIALSGERITANAAGREWVLHIAEAGIDDAINKMNAYANADLDAVPADADFRVIGEVYAGATVVKGVLGRGAYRVEITPPFATTPRMGPFRLVATATGNGLSRSIECWVAPDVDGQFFTGGLFGDVSLDASGTMSTDGYKSSDPFGYEPTVHVHDGKTYFYHRATGSVGSNGSITTNGNTLIFGDATPGPECSVMGGGFVLGTTWSAAGRTDLKPQIYQPPPGSMAVRLPRAVATAGGSTISIPPGEHRYVSINPSGQTEILVTGPTVIYVDGEIRMNAQQKFVLSGATASVKIFHGTGDAIVNGQTLLQGAKKVPGTFWMYSGTSDDIQFNGGAEIYAAVYAPYASYTHNGNADVYGAVVAREIRINGTARFHYDEDLSEPANPIYHYMTKSWRVVLP